MSKGLEALREIDKDTPFSLAFTQKFKERMAIIEKELKALEIIRKRLFDNENFDYLAWNNTYICIDGNVDLTKDEYDLLKEVLCEK